MESECVTEDCGVSGEHLKSIVTSQSALRIDGAIISGQFNLAGTSADVPIELTNCNFENPPVFDGAHLRSLKLSGSHCPGLTAANLRVDGNLHLDDGFTSTGKITLEDARIDGILCLEGATIGVAREIVRSAKDSETAASAEQQPDATLPRIETFPDETSDDVMAEFEKAIAAEQNTEDTNNDTILGAARLRLSGSLLAKGLTAHGKIDLISARIGGLLSLMGAHLHNSKLTTLQGERLQVGESIFLHRGFSSDGRVFLRNASVEGGIDLAGADLTARMSCVNLVHATVGRTVSFRGSTIDGSVELVTAKVGSSVNFSGAHFIRALSAVMGDRLAASTLNMRFGTPPVGIFLRYANLDIIEDDVSSWPAALRLDGCVYRMLESSTDVRVTQRLDWLRRDKSHYKPFRYDELITSYRTAGDETGAHRVGLEKQRRRTEKLPWLGCLWGRLQDITVGYGYRNGLALLWALGLIMVGSVVFDGIQPMAVKDKAPAFNSFLYSADLLLPIVNLGIKDHFVPQGYTQYVAAALRVLGWILTTVIVAGVTRLLSRPTR